MKRILVLFATVTLMATSLSAQVVPGMKYGELKAIYGQRTYVKSETDPYSRFWSGLASAAVPGLGQIICRETGRGFAILAGDLAFSIAESVCLYKALDYVQKDADGNPMKDQNGDLIITDERSFKKCGYTLLGIATADLIYWIWNICDARKVARIKNMYYQDLQGRAIDVNLYPSIDYALTADGTKPVAGMKLSVQF